MSTYGTSPYLWDESQKMKRGDMIFKLYVNCNILEKILGTLRIIARDYHGHLLDMCKYRDPPPLWARPNAQFF